MGIQVYTYEIQLSAAMLQNCRIEGHDPLSIGLKDEISCRIPLYLSHSSTKYSHNIENKRAAIDSSSEKISPNPSGIGALCLNLKSHHPSMGNEGRTERKGPFNRHITLFKSGMGIQVISDNYRIAANWLDHSQGCAVPCLNIGQKARPM